MTSPPQQRVSTRSLRLIADAVLSRGAATRAQLVEATGLSRPTISAAVAQMIADGRLIEQAEEVSQGVGRRSALLSWSFPDGVVIAMAAGHRHVTMSVASLDGTVMSSSQCDVTVDEDPHATAEWASRSLPDILASAEVTRQQIVAAGLVVPSPVLDNRIVAPPFRSGWEEFDITAEIGRLVDAPVVIENDANAAVIAEASAHRSAGDGPGGHIHVKISSGVGAGIMVDDTLVRGSDGRAGEIGHLVVDTNGDLCRCGNRGCLETVASIPSVLRRLAQVHPHVDREGLVRLLREGDGAAQRAMRDAGAAVGVAIAPVLATLGVTHATVGGLDGLISTDLIAGLRQGIDPLVHRDLAANLTLVEGRYGERSEIVGIVRLAVEAARTHARGAISAR